VKDQQVELKDKPFGLNLIGFAYGELGIGEDIRMAVAACEAAKIPYRIINIQPGDEIRQNDQLLKSQIEEGMGAAHYAINVFIMPGFDTASRIFLKLGDSAFKGFYNIGWWPWELSVWPKKWNRAFDLVDEIWAGSQFSFEMYQRSTQKPCQFMPLAVSVDRLKVFDRSHFRLPQNDFLFLYIFDFNSHLNRKNPDAAIEAFFEAFPMKSSSKLSKGTTDTNVGLVLKVMNTKPKDEAWLKFVNRCSQDPRIHLINTTLNREEVLGLIETCNAYVSPHRAEGFGRTMAEAMLLGKPVIAADYSGNAFYMDKEVSFPTKYQLIPVKVGDYHFVEDGDQAEWAEPSIQDMGRQMKQALKRSVDGQFRNQIKKYAIEKFSPAKTGKLIKVRLEKLEKLIKAL
jgi:glycosyltransferase involved in cell wall biosynthesis